MVEGETCEGEGGGDCWGGGADGVGVDGLVDALEHGDVFVSEVFEEDHLLEGVGGCGGEDVVVGFVFAVVVVGDRCQRSKELVGAY